MLDISFWYGLCTTNYRLSQKELDYGFAYYLGNQALVFKIFFSPETEIHMQILNTNLFLCDTRGPDIYKMK